MQACNPSTWEAAEGNQGQLRLVYSEQAWTTYKDLVSEQTKIKNLLYTSIGKK